MPLNFALAPKRYEPFQAKVTAESIAAYATASGIENPRHQVGSPDQIASLVYPVVPGWEAMGQVSRDPELGVDDPLMILHGEQAFTYHLPIRPGEELTITPVLRSVEDKGRDATFTSAFEARNPDGDLLVEAEATIFVRGAGSGAERQGGPRRPQAEDGELAARFTQHVPSEMPSAYAEASGDHNPIHLDAEVARSVGLPDVINHGLGTLSLISGGLVTHLADGEQGRVGSLRCRFRDIVVPGQDLVTEVRDAGETYAFATTREDGAVVVSGSVTLR